MRLGDYLLLIFLFPACRVNKFMTGFCTLVTKCKPALENLGKGELHHLKRCGFTGEPEADEIVCCPPSGIIPKEPDYSKLTQEPTKSHKMCKFSI